MLGMLLKNKLSSNTELSKMILLNSDLPPNKILDIYTNVNKINRVKDEVNDNILKIQKLDDKNQ